MDFGSHGPENQRDVPGDRQASAFDALVPDRTQVLQAFRVDDRGDAPFLSGPSGCASGEHEVLAIPRLDAGVAPQAPADRV